MGSKQKKRNMQPGNETTWLDKAAFATVVVASAIVPMIVRLHEVELKETTSQAYTGVASQLDFFSYNKATILSGCAIALLLYILSRVLQRRRIPLAPIHAPLGIYAICIIASSMASGAFSDIAWNGYPDRYEGATVLLCYVLLTFTISIMVTDEKRMDAVLWPIVGMTVIVGALGLSQFFDHDFLKTVVGRNMMLPTRHKNLIDTLTFNFGKGEMYTTVYNPNFLGSLSALLLPVGIGMYHRAIDQKKRMPIIAGGLFSVMAFVLWIGGMSRAGLVGGVIGIVLLTGFLARRMLRHWAHTLALFLVLVAAYVGMDAYSNYNVTREFLGTLPTSMASSLLTALDKRHPVVVEEDPEDRKTAYIPPVPPIDTSGSLVRKADIENNTFIFETDTESLKLKLDTQTLSLDVRDGQDKPLAVTNLPNQEINGKQISLMVFTNPQYADYSMYLIDSGTVFTWKGKSIALLVRDSMLLYQNKTNSAIAKMDNPSSIGFKGAELFASSRGYIWSRSFPLLKDTLLIGHGPDTFAAYFPQNDLASKMNWLQGPTDLVDKPHNWYLQLAINTGILSLVAVLVLLIWYGLRSLKRWALDDGSSIRSIGVAILCGLIGYCVAGVFNDSVVSVAPVFWAILGLGIALLRFPKPDTTSI